MIITCAKCATQFQLDGARVPKAGIRVRCSICKSAFFVAHPDELEDPASAPVDRVVREVLDAEPRGVPEPTADLETPDASTRPAEEGGGESWEFIDGGASDAAGHGARDRFEESFEAARGAVDDLLGSPWQPPEPFPDSSPVDSPDAPPEEGYAPSVGIEPPGPGDEAPGLSLSDDPWETPAWSDRDEASAGPEEVASRAAQPTPFGTSFSLDPELREADGLPALGEELPESDELEIDSDGDSFGSEALEAFETPRADFGPIDAELPSPERASHLATPGGPELDAPVQSREAPIQIGFGSPLELPRRGSSVLAWLARAGNGLGSSAVAILAALALWGSVAPRSLPAHAPGSQALAGLEATGVAGRWVENATLGSLYVVSGKLHNPGAETKAPRARLVVRLLDAQGVPVEEAAASLGPPLGARLLREGGSEDLREVVEAGALALARTPVSPGERVPFEAVVLTLPDTAQRFDLAQAR